jgi:hypothetical protein
VKEGLAVCLDPVLRCDMHPQCDKGEDEENCYVEYRRRGYLDSSATMKCKSPHHNSGNTTVTIWAAPCDGREECFQGRDERGCDTGLLVYILLGGILDLVIACHRLYGQLATNKRLCHMSVVIVLC